ncbi:hypothetical protein E2C01_099920 [Portunus trituberculatus]|uniref:Uncharacterized protein n=1 Tax=Portunus trituberculatus TaxID=210409 RepID=A0A5B7K6Q6_PORTR|nr:hypothetical protein [Portunus trituberculatus]
MNVHLLYGTTSTRGLKGNQPPNWK